MNTKFNSWLWPARPMGKRQVKALQGEHNRLVNSHQQLVEACQALVRAWKDAPMDAGARTDRIDAMFQATEALATATGHLKGVQK